MIRSVKIIWILGIIVSSILFFGLQSANAEEDPFGAPPLKTAPNCGPEMRSKIDAKIDSKDALILILQSPDNQIGSKLGYSWQHSWQNMTSFKNQNSTINWDELKKNIKEETVDGKSFYSLSFNVDGCSTYQFHTLKVTKEGHLSLYGCCGK